MRYVLFGLFLLAQGAFAEPDTVPLPDLESILGSKTFVPKQVFTAEMRLLNRRTAKTEQHFLTQTTTMIIDDLEVSARRCVPNAQGVEGNDVVWLEMKTISGAPVFSGWIYALYPGVSTPEHPVFAIQLVSCS